MTATARGCLFAVSCLLSASIHDYDSRFTKFCCFDSNGAGRARLVRYHTRGLAAGERNSFDFGITAVPASQLNSSVRVASSSWVIGRRRPSGESHILAGCLVLRRNPTISKVSLSGCPSFRRHISMS